MRPVKRSKVSKLAEAKRFNREAVRTLQPNQALTPMRGGFRL